jgi:elongator complex protein 3
MEFKREILREVIEKLLETEDLTRYKIEEIMKDICKKYRLAGIPTNVQLLKVCSEKEKVKLKAFLLKKPIRTMSGIATISIATKPVKCVWGKCIYCPKGENSPQSYAGTEPVIQRAVRKNFDSFLQVQDRLDQYKAMGHSSENGDKIEVIVIGGTFLALETEYKENFVKGIYDGLNGFESETMEEAQKTNENAVHRCVNLTIETRPDFCKEKHVDEMLSYGVTRVEVGVQSIFPEVLDFINRGHSIEDVIEATKIAKNAALKVNYHIMPGLPKSDLDKDLQTFRTIFEDQNFKPDYLKIYPTVVVEGTELFNKWKNGQYESYSTDEMVEFLAKVKKIIPKYCRIQHIGRLIPANDVKAGSKKTNIRQLVQWKAGELGIKCRCIRCREVGFKINYGIYPEKIKLTREEYEASDGEEIFLSFEDIKNDIILGFLRLRIPNRSHRSEIDKKTALVRELKVLGSTVPVKNLPDETQMQHRGYGKQLMSEAERIAREEFGKNKMVVMSAVGTRRYYFDLGYERDGVFVSKLLS